MLALMSEGRLCSLDHYVAISALCSTLRFKCEVLDFQASVANFYCINQSADGMFLLVLHGQTPKDPSDMAKSQ